MAAEVVAGRSGDLSLGGIEGFIDRPQGLSQISGDQAQLPPDGYRGERPVTGNLHEEHAISRMGRLDSLEQVCGKRFSGREGILAEATA